MPRGTWVPDPGSRTVFAYWALTVYGWPFQVHLADRNFCNFLRGLQPPLALPRNPDWTTLAGLTSRRFRLFPVRSPLLGESRLLSFPRGTEMFQFPRFPLPGYVLARQ